MCTVLPSIFTSTPSGPLPTGPAAFGIAVDDGTALVLGGALASAGFEGVSVISTRRLICLRSSVSFGTRGDDSPLPETDSFYVDRSVSFLSRSDTALARRSDRSWLCASSATPSV